MSLDCLEALPAGRQGIGGGNLFRFLKPKPSKLSQPPQLSS